MRNRVYLEWVKVAAGFSLRFTGTQAKACGYHDSTMPTKKIAKTHRVAVKKTHVHVAEEQTVREQPDVIPLRLYKRIALTFVFFVAVALIAVTYLSTMQAVIRVQTVPVEITADFIVRTVETATTDG